MTLPVGHAEREPGGEIVMPATGLAGIAMAFLEPDPTTELNNDRLAQVHRTLAAWVTPGP